jgi:clostripain
MKNLKIIFIIILFVSEQGFFTSFNKAHSQTGWTVVVYISADNNLSSAGIEDLNEMEGAMNGVSSNVIVLIDELGNNNTNAYEVEYDSYGPTHSPIISTQIPLSTINSSWGNELNMGSGQTLEDFTIWCINNYPANKYALILWDHGSGWLKSTSPEEKVIKSVCWDDYNGDHIEMDELRNSIISIYQNTNDTKIDLLGMDACLMAMIEVYYQFYSYADIGVASEEIEPNDGWEYAFLSELATSPNMDASTLGAHIVEYYGNSYSDGQSDPTDVNYFTLSTFYIDKLAKLNSSKSVAQITNHLGNILCSNMYDYYTKINTAQNNCNRFNNRSNQPDDYIDLYDFGQKIKNENITSDFNNRTQELMDTINSSVIYERHGSQRNWAHGISIYFEENDYEYEDDYNTTSHFLEFTRYSSWDEMHHTFYNNSTIEWEEEINISGDFSVATNADLTVKQGTNVNLWNVWDEVITIFHRNCIIENNSEIKVVE